MPLVLLLVASATPPHRGDDTTPLSEGEHKKTAALLHSPPLASKPTAKLCAARTRRCSIPVDLSAHSVSCLWPVLMSARNSRCGPFNWVPSPPMSARIPMSPRSTMDTRLAVGLWVFHVGGSSPPPKLIKYEVGDLEPTAPGASRRRPLGRFSGLCVDGCGFALGPRPHFGPLYRRVRLRLGASAASRVSASAGTASPWDSGRFSGFCVGGCGFALGPRPPLGPLRRRVRCRLGASADSRASLSAGAVLSLRFSSVSCGLAVGICYAVVRRARVQLEGAWFSNDCHEDRKVYFDARN